MQPPGAGRDGAAKWPKPRAQLTDAQREIAEDFVKYWHEVLPRRFGLVESFNHGYPVRHAARSFTRTLEIGAGFGEHLEYERLTPEQRRNYYTLELRESMASRIAMRFPEVNAITGDCQERLDFADGFFDRILAIHVLEHLPNLRAAVREMYRLCNKDSGVFSVVIPCEGGLAYSLARRISAQRVFERRYPGQSYDWFIGSEHINRPHEIFDELEPYFEMTHSSFFPIPVPMVTLNLCIGTTLKPRSVPIFQSAS